MNQPLAYRMRPTHIDNIVGQQHLVGKGKIIRRMVEAKMLSSMILYGPPGIGKTSIASAIAGTTKYAFRILNAASDTKKDLQIVVEEAKMSGTVILLLDEIHRLDKPKQDFLLPHLENGRIILIGATTENPYITINPAIRSRTQIFELKTLSNEDIQQAMWNAVKDPEKGFGKEKIAITDQALLHFSRATSGDLRSSLNGLELAIKSTAPDEQGTINITLEIAEECVQRKALTHDKDGDAHYDADVDEFSAPHLCVDESVGEQRSYQSVFTLDRGDCSRCICVDDQHRRCGDLGYGIQFPALYDSPPVLRDG